MPSFNIKYPSSYKKYDSSTYGKTYRKKHAVKLKAIYKKTETTLRVKILNLLGDQCLKCGFKDARALQIDHIYGGGCRERNTNGIFYYKNVIKSIESLEGKYQLLCANCNWIKRHENNERSGSLKNDNQICKQNQKLHPELPL